MVRCGTVALVSKVTHTLIDGTPVHSRWAVRVMFASKLGRWLVDSEYTKLFPLDALEFGSFGRAKESAMALCEQWSLPYIPGASADGLVSIEQLEVFGDSDEIKVLRVMAALRPAPVYKSPIGMAFESLMVFQRTLAIANNSLGIMRDTLKGV